MWDIKLNTTKEQDKQTNKNADMDNSLVGTRGEEGTGKAVKGVKYLATEGDVTLGDKHNGNTQITYFRILYLKPI